MIEKRVIFEPATPSSVRRKLAIGSFGPAGSGKTALLATMPGKVGVITLDSKTQHILLRRAKELGYPNDKYVWPGGAGFVRIAHPMRIMEMPNTCEKPKPEAKDFDKTGWPTCCQRHLFRHHLDRIKAAVFSLVEDESVDSIAIDGASQLSEDVKYANYGRTSQIKQRDLGAYYSEMREILLSAKLKHLVVTHEPKEIWLNDKSTGRFWPRTWPGLDFAVDVIAEHGYTEPKKKEPGQFWLSVRQSNDRPDLLGEAGDKLLVDEAISFPMLAMSIFPDSDPDDWE